MFISNFYEADFSSDFSVLDFEGTSRTYTAFATEIGLVRLSTRFKRLEEYESVLQPSPGMSKIRKSQDLGIPFLSESDAFYQ